MIRSILSPQTNRNAEDIDQYAVVAELADAHGSGPCGLTPRGGSSPLDRITLSMKGS